MSANSEMIRKILDNIPQYPEEITKRKLCKIVGIKSETLNSYLCTATYISMVCENGEFISRCDKFYA